MMTHHSWKELSPYGNNLDREDFSDYLERIYATELYRHIPQVVLEQWIYPHHDNEWMVKNYAWIDFSSVSLVEQEWDISQLMAVKAIEVFENSITGIDVNFESVSALEEDELYWEQNGTWRVPPIILDTSSVIGRSPRHAELHLPYQLVEGHSRMRNLRISKIQSLFLADKHIIYVLCI
jgi:glutaredoxin